MDSEVDYRALYFEERRLRELAEVDRDLATNAAQAYRKYILDEFAPNLSHQPVLQDVGQVDSDYDDGEPGSDQGGTDPEPDQVSNAALHCGFMHSNHLHLLACLYIP